MKKIMKSTLLALCCSMAASAVADYTDTYSFSMSVKVPRIYDNTESQGYRKYQTQVIKGHLNIVYPEATVENPYPRPRITITDLVNTTHKISGKSITYEVRVNNVQDEEYLDGPITRVNLIGNNKTKKFDTASVVFYIDADPSYNVGDDVEDNALLVTLAGSGKCKEFVHYQYVCQNGKLKKVAVGKCKAIKSLSGQVAGALGCGCMACGHTSPTRVADACGASDIVDDVAAVFGKWKATYLRSDCECE